MTVSYLYMNVAQNTFKPIKKRIVHKRKVYQVNQTKTKHPAHCSPYLLPENVETHLTSTKLHRPPSRVHKNMPFTLHGYALGRQADELLFMSQSPNTHVTFLWKAAAMDFADSCWNSIPFLTPIGAGCFLVCWLHHFARANRKLIPFGLGRLCAQNFVRYWEWSSLR